MSKPQPLPRIGNAPVSYGVYGRNADPTMAAGLVSTMASSGYEGSELGPPGFFGSPERTAGLFADAGLLAVGAYVPMHLPVTGAVLSADLARVRRTCEELTACGGTGIVILADEGTPDLLLHPARSGGADDPRALGPLEWRRAAEALEQALEIVSQYGLVSSFHPHISTFVESPWEIERLLGISEIALTLDIGHLQLAGGDPVTCAAAWRSHINHVHVKDVRTAVLQAAKRARRTDFDVWWAEVATPLGEGDVDIDGVLGALADTDYRGWLVIEQDRAPATPDCYPAIAEEQAKNLIWLRERVRANYPGSATTHPATGSQS